jgi:hypothetical protein
LASIICTNLHNNSSKQANQAQSRATSNTSQAQAHPPYVCFLCHALVCVHACCTHLAVWLDLLLCTYLGDLLRCGWLYRSACTAGCTYLEVPIPRIPPYPSLQS